MATIVGSSLVFIDGSVVGLALPTIQRTMNASATDVQWIVEGYTLALAALMLFGGSLGDRYGRKRIFMIGTALFAAASLACSLAPTIGFLIGARVVQGIGGMLLAPASLAIIGACFEGAKRDRAYAAWSAYGALTSALGPAIGGVFIDHFGWRSVFLINLPLAAVVLWATIAHVTESMDDEARKSGRLDALGAALATVGLGALTYALIASAQYGWGEPRIYGSATAAVLALVAFIIVERRVRSPIMPLSLFANRTFAGVNLETLLLYSFGSLFYFLPFDMMQVHGYSATAAAIAMLPLIAGLVLLARYGTVLMHRIGARAILTIGPAIAGIGVILLGVFERGDTYWTSFMPGIIVVGIGMGLTVAPLTATVMSSAEPRHIGAASGINNAVSRTAGLLAIAALGAILWSSFNTRLDTSLNAMHATHVQRIAVDAERPKQAATTIADPKLHAAILDAYRGGFSIIAYTCGIVVLLAAAIGFLTIEKNIAEPEAT